MKKHPQLSANNNCPRTGCDPCIKFINKSFHTTDCTSALFSVGFRKRNVRKFRFSQSNGQVISPGKCRFF